ncbi:HSF-type DNA-binding-domain-containing protein [Radiomyces spectabilis]|uniref:HSF-type DNA-binding-domain-containing protein n=1 Tax=Radiomyces spectabilis TaxID=64574 RepID=UPI00221EEFCB|nr:HSF-type DNA-binding-domain-containing protein [Radiomyces spectabilis]KAI8374400.1 HSF-type DNA-binding-domain-containing protein [Radiomyces spectabilis]
MTHHRRKSSNISVTSEYSGVESLPSSHRSSFSIMPGPVSASTQYPSFPSHLAPQPPPPPTTQKPTHTNAFVHKLYNMVIDSQYQHLIAWNYTGSSFIVCNIMEFSRDVLPKHFKHNNFSSFVRQLNMYGFHKVNKSPRGHRTLAENQIWEFSHAKFLRNRPDLLDEIKRKAMESESNRRDTGDMQAHMAMIQASQNDMLQQMSHLFANFNEVVNELAETKRKQEQQQQTIQNLLDYIMQNNGGQLPGKLNTHQYDMIKQEKPPSIFITSHDHLNQHGNMLQDMFMQTSRTPLTVQTQNLHHSSTEFTNSCHRPSMTLTPYGHHLPPSPSSSSMVSDDDIDGNTSMYSPNSPIPRPSTSSSSHSSQIIDLLDTSHSQPSSQQSNSVSFDFVNSLNPLAHQ